MCITYIHVRHALAVASSGAAYTSQRLDSILAAQSDYNKVFAGLADNYLRVRYVDPTLIKVCVVIVGCCVCDVDCVW